MTKECPNKKAASNKSTSTTTPPKAPTPSPKSSSSPTTTSVNKTVRIDDRPEVENVPSREEEASSSADRPAPDLKEVLADVGKMLKAMSAGNMKKASVIEVGFEEKLKQVEAAMKTATIASTTSAEGLLDSGASHAMRKASEKEYLKGIPIRVTLAGEDVRDMKQNIQGTVLVKDNGAEVQPIVPLGTIIEELNCRLQWKRGSLRLHHPTKGYIKVIPSTITAQRSAPRTPTP